jgi:hypothetical protein
MRVPGAPYKVVPGASLIVSLRQRGHDDVARIAEHRRQYQYRRGSEGCTCGAHQFVDYCFKAEARANAFLQPP